MMEIFTELPWTITAGWSVIVIWAIAQYVWWQRLFVTPAPAPVRHESSRRSECKRPPAPAAPVGAAVTALPTGGTPEFLAELGLQNTASTPAPATPPLGESESVYH